MPARAHSFPTLVLLQVLLSHTDSSLVTENLPRPDAWMDKDYRMYLGYIAAFNYGNFCNFHRRDGCSSPGGVQITELGQAQVFC